MSRFSNGCVLRVAALALTAPGVALAGNGLNVYGNGARSMGMGGADLAVTGDVASTAINPAGLSAIGAHEAMGYVEGYRTFLRHEDDLGNSRFVDNPNGFLAGGGYAQKWRPSSPVTVGIGLFAQGGSGFTYEHLSNDLGAPDEMSSMFGVFRLATSLAWHVNEQLDVGATLGINYASAAQKVFPNQSLPSGNGFAGFQGINMKDADGVSFNGKLGVLYHPAPQWTIGLTYASRTPIKLEGGDLTLNYSADGKGYVKYRNAEVRGLSLPREAGLGVAWRSGAKWTLTGEVTWLDYSNAVKESVLRANSPNRADVPQEVAFASALEFRDQYVFAIGTEYVWDERTKLRAGFNYARNPVPDRNLSPVMNIISEHAYSIGASRVLGSRWSLDSSLTVVPPETVRYSNPYLGLGTSQKERFAIVQLNTTLTRRW